ncbi:MAG: hypothetical protein A3B90_01760 [Candidatus Magasanikbacteria bacterium RIFCSPHIGHO2_02_FULL_41_13]|uniref:Uncharacterized protein n=1 Tax=Candidatus Magasanikbacteria bacterium RIFCSPHIGHO2_02_FULL_41_13 TaxID=1798676 RepID=A0A1F6M3X5_9BACT|nr:MAG: hypothetical protein A3B90_01760 [Candidatus Magasanikbacteria bacterium RIFCSPHIGHO2_02_FULL_41_13]
MSEVRPVPAESFYIEAAEKLFVHSRLHKKTVVDMQTGKTKEAEAIYLVVHSQGGQELGEVNLHNLTPEQIAEVRRYIEAIYIFAPEVRPDILLTKIKVKISKLLSPNEHEKPDMLDPMEDLGTGVEEEETDFPSRPTNPYGPGM